MDNASCIFINIYCINFFKKSKRDEIVFKMQLTSKEETDILNKKIESLAKKIQKIEKNYLKKKT